MNYLCTRVTKDVTIQKSFNAREEAMEYFERQFGPKIYEKRMREKERIEKSIQMYRKKIDKEMALQECLDYEDEFCPLDRYCKLLEKKEQELERFLEIMDDRPVSDEEKPEIDREILLEGGEQKILYMAAIYKRNGAYKVEAEDYYCKTCIIKDAVDVKTAREQLPEQMGREAVLLYLSEETTGIDKGMRKVSKFRTQVLRDYSKEKIK